MDARSVLAVVLICAQAIVVVPILARLFRARSAHGVSLSTELIWVACGAGWAIYGGVIESTALTISGVLAAVASATIASVSWGMLPEQRSIATLLGLATAVVIGSGFTIAGVEGFAVALSVVGVLQFIPQLWLSARLVRSDASTPGVSVIGGVLRAAYCFGWAVYGAAWPFWGMALDRIEWPLVAWGLAGTLAFIVQAVPAMSRRPSR